MNVDFVSGILTAISFVSLGFAAWFFIGGLMDIKIRKMTVEQLKAELGDDYRELRYIDKRKMRG